ncbi:MAG: carbon-nitrogen hydrolase family protein [Dehalococcoidia bacterium]|nr:carbon-nitrogen hydrolase family protein [Dehalococcoidia bacterium]
MPDNMVIAAAQLDIKLGETQTNLARMLAYTGEAAGNGARLVIFPECSLTGYQFDSREEALSYAEAVPGPAVNSIATMCLELNVHVIFGLLEVSGDNLFNTSVLVGPAGVVYTYHKNHVAFQAVDRFVSKGDKPFELCEIPNVRIGLELGYDTFFPEAARVHSLLGADLVVLQTNFATTGLVERTARITTTRAIENKVYVVWCNRVGQERGYPFRGRSKIMDPMGMALARASDDNEEIIYAELEPDKARSKRITHFANEWELDRFADRRPELYGPITQPRTT